MNSCRNTAASGCKCWEHALGLVTYAPDPTALLAALERTTPTVQLRVVTEPTPSANPHGWDQRQPWEPRAPRHQKRAA